MHLKLKPDKTKCIWFDHSAPTVPSHCLIPPLSPSYTLFFTASNPQLSYQDHLSLELKRSEKTSSSLFTALNVSCCLSSVCTSELCKGHYQISCVYCIQTNIHASILTYILKYWCMYVSLYTIRYNTHKNKSSNTHTRTTEIILMMQETDSHTTQPHDITLHYRADFTLPWLPHAQEASLTSHIWSLLLTCGAYICCRRTCRFAVKFWHWRLWLVPYL